VVTVSIITVVKDDALGLIATCESAIDQTFKQWELLIVAAPSVDETLCIAKKYQGMDSRIQLRLQSGSGIYQAMNEGIKETDKEFLWFMNAGDRFAARTVLAHAIGTLSRADCGVVIGGYKINNSSSERTFSYSARDVSALRFAFNRRGGCHQAMIFRTQVLKSIGGFDPSYSLASDFDLVLKVINKAGATRVSEIYAEVEPGGRADQGIKIVHDQKHEIRNNLFGSPLINLASFTWTCLARMRIAIRNSALKSD
jgi:glycosyltransferase involved in cell wall biosynthesis